jgi:hypothetical protein
MPEVIYQYQQAHVLADGKTLQSWVDCSEEYCEAEKAEGGNVRILYTAAPPAVLPPEKPVVFGSDLCQDIENYGYNLALADTRQLGAQQQKVVELPESFKQSNSDNRHVMFREDVIYALDAAGVKWEVQK